LGRGKLERQKKEEVSACSAKDIVGKSGVNEDNKKYLIVEKKSGSRAHAARQRAFKKQRKKKRNPGLALIIRGKKEKERRERIYTKAECPSQEKFVSEKELGTKMLRGKETSRPGTLPALFQQARNGAKATANERGPRKILRENVP